MTSEPAFSVFQYVQSRSTKKPITKKRRVKTDGTFLGAEKAVEKLKKAGVHRFEIMDHENNQETRYKKTLSGNNYEVKVLKVSSK